MNFFRKLFTRKKPEPPSPTYPRALKVQNFRFLYNNTDYIPKIEINYDNLKNLFRRIHQVSEKWNLVYSTYKHGRSLQIMREFQRNYTPPFLFIIEDCSNKKFGVFFDEHIDIKKGIFGNLFTFLFRYDRDRDMFVKYDAFDNFICYSTNAFIAFGCSGGYYGLLLNSDMHTGESHTVDTFRNEVLGYDNKFFIAEVEMWSICL